VTYQMPIDDRHNYPKEYLTARISGALGGRAAEEIVFGDITTGAENDLQQVTAIARQMVTRWGMSEEVGLLALDGNSQENYLAVELGRPRWYSEDTARLVDHEVKRIVDECHQQALDILRRERRRLEALAEALLQRESLDEAEIHQVVGELQRQAA
jgi:cell division protease FtsH